MIEATDRAAVWSFFHDRLGLHWSEDFRGVLHVPEEFAERTCDRDDVAVGIAFNAFVGKTCCIHVVIQRPELFSARIIRDAFRFAFDVCGCVAVYGLVDSINAQALDMDKRLGFVEVDRVPGGGTDGDLVVLRLDRTACRWLKPH